MRRNTLVVIGAVGLLDLSGVNIIGQQAAPARQAAPAPAVPNLSTDKAMFWSATEIQGRWKENEALKRANSRLFNGPTNISANVRIVLPGDQPLVHETTADLWIVTEGTAVARTDGKMVDSGGVRSISNGIERPVKPGDVLNATGRAASLHGPEGLQGVADALRHEGPRPIATGASRSNTCGDRWPGHARDTAGRARATRAGSRGRQDDVLGRRGYRGAVEEQRGQQANQFTDLQRAREHQRERADRPPGDPPLTHVETADLWRVTAGEAVARTDGEMVTENGTRTIRNGVERPVRAGDVLYVPPGVPHHFTDMKGFRAWLIRYDVEGWAQSIAPPAPAPPR